MEETLTEQKRTGISGSVLKWIAILSMFIDHSAAVLVEAGWIAGLREVSYYEYLLMRGVGRLAFPIYCFLLVEGFLHTRNVKKYLLRLGLFALISELPFDLAMRRSFFTLRYQNVFFTLFIGLLALTLWRWLTQRKGFQAVWWRQTLGLLGIVALAWLAAFCRTDYGWQGVAVISLMYLLRERPIPRDLGSLAVLYTSSILELAAFPDVVLFQLYNGQRGRQSKYFFYIFYPAHLLILAGIRRALWGL